MADTKAQAEAEVALREVEGDWNKAAQPWNPARLAALYTEDALFYGGRPGHAVGQAAVRAYFDSYVGMIASARLALTEQQLRPLGDGIRLAQGYAAFDIDMVAGGTSVTMLRSTLVLVRRAEGWRIAQHHFSATPAEPKSNCDQ